MNVGDWVELQQVFVEEYRGTTFLQYLDKNTDGSRPMLTVVSHGHSLPRPLVVDVNEIKAPEYLSAADAWLVADHRAERFESMLLQIRGCGRGQQGLGKAQDNYELQSFREPNDTGAVCWASDYAELRIGPKPTLYLAGIESGPAFPGGDRRARTVHEPGRRL